MRVAPNMEPDILAGIQQGETNLQTALQQVSTGRRVNLPGDDPAASADLVQNLAESSNVDQYTKNANTALGQVQTADSVLTSVVSLLTQAVSLGTEGASSTTTASNRQAIATQIQGILSSVVAEANTSYGGVSIFAGSASTAAAFVPDSSSPTGYTYQGNSETNQVQVGDSLQVQVNVPGSTLFTNSSASVLGSLSQLATALASGSTANVGSATTAVDSALNYISAQHAVLGNSINQLNTQESFLSQETITLSTQASNLVDVDTATAAENLAQAEAQNSAVLEAAAKALPTSLLNYLK